MLVFVGARHWTKSNRGGGAVLSSESTPRTVAPEIRIKSKRPRRFRVANVVTDSFVTPSERNHGYENWTDTASRKQNNPTGPCLSINENAGGTSLFTVTTHELWRARSIRKGVLLDAESYIGSTQDSRDVSPGCIEVLDFLVCADACILEYCTDTKGP